eukprot:NODE_1120_length_1883_cov_76.273864_g1061_i0.p1 GENE.NODE_1120_length_1883_cov_76.273864_g1061_i0~~NODE_1120_length_1883_cov_76.273864_g1061_i0.p1  ORF type:complete len:581 (+),score=153.21 NODE_1120_length_1883_cov_76.273864_g1061_i0:61-1743(+)
MSGLGFFDQEDIVDRANFPETPILLDTYDADDKEVPADSTDASYLPELVKKFIQDFHKAFRKKDQALIFQLYEGAFNELSEKYYKSTHWPPVEVIAPLVDTDQLFLVLYKEMYYRHIYSISSGQMVTLEDRVESFQNYFNLFTYILKTGVDKIDLALPNQWIWDIIDEFIWQFNDYARFRSKLARMSLAANPDEEVERNAEFVKNQKDIWSTVYVITTLNELVKKSGIKTILEEEEKKGGSIEVLESSGSLHFVRMLGYYSVIGLLRIHTILGDYYCALKAIDCIDFTKRVQLFSKVVACHITLYYYTGFVFMMQRRYADAIRFFTQLLTYINRIKNIHTKSYQYDDILKKNEQIYHLLAMTLSLCPQRHGIDEAVMATLRDRLGDKITRLTQGDIECYSEMFKYACPKFIALSTSFEAKPDTNGVWEALELQRNVFLNEVKQQLVLPTIRSYLSLYSTITVGKLATFMEQDNHKVPEHVFKTYLLRLKHKTRQLVWTGGKPSEGERSSIADIGFYIDKDMVYIQNYATLTGKQRSHAQYFVEQIRYLKPCLDTLCNKAA